MVAALTFGAGIDDLVDDPSNSGWNWTFAPDLADDEDVQTLLEVPGVTDVGQLSFRQVVTEGQRLTGIALRADKGSPALTVVSGRTYEFRNTVSFGIE